jgi:hypothetical protein
LLVKILRISLSGKDYTNHAFIAREGMEEDTVLVILKVFVDLVLPKYTAGAYDVDEGKEMGTSGTVCYEHEGAL